MTGALCQSSIHPSVSGTGAEVGVTLDTASLQPVRSLALLILLPNLYHPSTSLYLPWACSSPRYYHTSCLDNCHQLLLLLVVGHHRAKVLCSKFVTHYDPPPSCCLKSFKVFVYMFSGKSKNSFIQLTNCHTPGSSVWWHCLHPQQLGFTVLWPACFLSAPTLITVRPTLGVSLFYLPEIRLPPLLQVLQVRLPYYSWNKSPLYASQPFTL